MARSTWQWGYLQVKLHELGGVLPRGVKAPGQRPPARLFLKAMDLSVESAKIQFVILVDTKGRNVEVSLNQ